MNVFKKLREWQARTALEAQRVALRPRIAIDPEILTAVTWSQMIARMAVRDPEGFEALLSYLSSRRDYCFLSAEQSKSDRDEFVGASRELRFILETLEQTTSVPSALEGE